MVIHFAYVIHAAHVGVGNPAGSANFIAKAFQHAFIIRNRFRQKLQRYRLTQRQVIGAINFSHAALPQQRNNPVAIGQQSPRKKTSLARHP